MGRLCLILILSQFATINTSYAALGESDSQVTVDQQKIRATHVQRSTQSNYSVHELSSELTTVKEFSGSDGVVFAVSWRGVFRPDLKSLFGVYYDGYQKLDAARPRMRGRAPVTVRTDKIVVEKGGHMRDVHGLAYIPSRLPAGVHVEDLQ